MQQQKERNVQKSVLHRRPFNLFFPFSFLSPFTITPCYFFFCFVFCFLFFFWGGGGQNYKYINESFAFSSGEICRTIISLHVGSRLRSCPHQPVFDSRTCISACWFLALSHQKRLSPDMSLLPGFSQTRLLHTALASTAPAVFSFFPLTTCLA